MAVSKDIEKGTWTSQVWVEDWQGKKKHKKKRGFATKKEALEWEHSILLAAKADMNMKLADFVDLYFRDKETELKARTVRNKRYMIEQHVAPMLGDKPMDGITPADIIQWQNYIRSKGFKETYQRMLQNQLTALFTHATKIYNLKDNPCAKVKRIGKADADKKQLQFWTLDEFSKFIATFEEGSRYHVLFDLLFYSGCRIGEALALMPKDFDLTNRKVSITKTYFRHKGVDEITEPKTEESIRTVIIPEFLVDEIKEYMESMYKLPENKVHIRRWGSMRLYRIISLETFIDLLHNKRERYVRPATWEDTFEGYLYSKLYDAEERKKIVRDIYYNVCPANRIILRARIQSKRNCSADRSTGKYDKDISFKRKKAARKVLRRGEFI